MDGGIRGCDLAAIPNPFLGIRNHPARVPLPGSPPYRGRKLHTSLIVMAMISSTSRMNPTIIG